MLSNTSTVVDIAVLPLRSMVATTAEFAMIDDVSNVMVCVSDPGLIRSSVAVAVISVPAVFVIVVTPLNINPRSWTLSAIMAVSFAARVVRLSLGSVL